MKTKKESRKTRFPRGTDRGNLNGWRNAFPSWDPLGFGLMMSHLDGIEVRLKTRLPDGPRDYTFEDGMAIWDVYYYRFSRLHFSDQPNHLLVMLDHTHGVSSFAASFSP